MQKLLTMKFHNYNHFFVHLLFVFGFNFFCAQNTTINLEENSKKIKSIIYFNPEIIPEVEEIKSITYDSFFSSVSNRFSRFRNNKMLRVETPISYDQVDTNTVKEIITNNDGQYAVVARVKFFKVGIGNYVFSSQVVVSMKLYDAKGNLITESKYDTFKKNARIFGSAENSIKIGTDGALKIIIKNLRKQKHLQNEGF